MRYGRVVKGLALIGVLALPASLSAQTVEYSSIQSRQGTGVIVKQSTLAGEQWFECDISTRACEEADEAAQLTGGNTSPTPNNVALALLPPGASRVVTSSDGRYTAFYIAATQTRGKRTFGVIDSATSQIYTKDETISYWDLLTEGVRIFAFSPDSKTLLYIDDIANHPTLYRVNLSALANGELRSTKMFTREYSVADVAWKDDANIFFIANREGPYEWALYEYNLTTGALSKRATDVSYAVPLQKEGSVLIFAEASATGVRPKFYDTQTQTAYSLALPSSSPLQTQGKVVTTLLHDLSGVFLLEASGNSNTLLVWLHGGPYRQTSDGYHPYLSYGGYDWVLEKARRADVGVLKIDYPGSMGYGRLFAESVTGKVGVTDAGETAAAIADFAKRNGYTNVYLMGNSYGGYLAMKLLVDNPSRYKGAMSIAGVADWTTLLTALSNSIFNVQFGGTVSDENNNYDVHANASIYNKLGNLSGQKVVLVHGNRDFTIPYRQSEGLASYMETLGKPVTFITMEDEDHVFKKPESFTRLCEATLELVGKTDTSSCAI